MIIVITVEPFLCIPLVSNSKNLPRTLAALQHPVDTTFVASLSHPPFISQDGLCWVPLHAPSLNTIAVGKAPENTTVVGRESRDSLPDHGDREDDSHSESSEETAELSSADKRVGGDGSSKDGGSSGDKLAEGYLAFDWDGVEGLAATHDLCATGPAFGLALDLGAENPAIGR